MFDAKNKDIEAIKNAILQTVPCERIYLFGSYAHGAPTDESDYDIYVVMPNASMRPLSAMQLITRSIRGLKINKPVDVLVGHASDFSERKSLPTIEKSVARNGVVLYGLETAV